MNSGIFIDLTYIAIGLVLLYYGGEFLITGCVRVSREFKISPFIIGATVVGFGTSSPELAVSVLAAYQDSPELALGNVIGSNIANVGLVLGITAMVIPITIAKERFKEESPPLLVATFTVLLLAWDLQLGRLEGIFMVLMLAAYLLISLLKKDDSTIGIEDTENYFVGRGIGMQSLLILAGLVLLILGAKLLVKGGVHFAEAFGVSEWFIGISIVALGTSLPEMFSSLIAAKKGHGEMAIGNVFGSNIFNILMVLGVTASIHPLNIVEQIHPDLLFTTFITCLLLVLIRTGYTLSKKEGALLLTGYVAYLTGKGMGII